MSSVSRVVSDYLLLPEIVIPIVLGATAAVIDGFTTGGLGTLIASYTLISAYVAAQIKFLPCTLEYISDLSIVTRDVPPRIREKPYYFDTAPEGPLNSEKPILTEFGKEISLKRKAQFMVAANGGAGVFLLGSLAMAAPPMTMLLLLGGATTLPFLFSSYRYGQVALGNWDITDRPPPQKKAPEKVDASLPKAAIN